MVTSFLTRRTTRSLAVLAALVAVGGGSIALGALTHPEAAEAHPVSRQSAAAPTSEDAMAGGGAVGAARHLATSHGAHHRSGADEARANGSRNAVSHGHGHGRGERSGATATPFTRADLATAALPAIAGAAPGVLADGTYTDPTAQINVTLDAATSELAAAPTIAEVTLPGGTAGIAATVSVAGRGPVESWVVLWDAAGTPLDAVRLPGFEDGWPEYAVDLATIGGGELLARYTEIGAEEAQLGNLIDESVPIALTAHGLDLDPNRIPTDDNAFKAAGLLLMAVQDGDATAESTLATPAAREVLDESVDGGPTLRQLVSGTDGSFTERCDSVTPPSGDAHALAWRCDTTLDAPNDDTAFGVFVERSAPFTWTVTDIAYTPRPGEGAPNGN